MSDLSNLDLYFTAQRERGGLEVFRNVKLSSCCSFEIGGPADFIVYPKTENALINLIKFASENYIRFDVFGNASNVLFDDEGYRGIVIFTSELDGLELINNNLINSGSGTPLTELAVFAQSNGLSGLEFAYGIPGSVGGAVFMNAGAYGGEIKDICISSKVFDIKNNLILEICGEGQNFGYRESVYMHNKTIILASVFKLIKADLNNIKLKMDEYMGRRRDKQPLEYPSAGSAFKRCNGFFTAQLIEESGLKGTTEGGAQVSDKHAGFIINCGGATSSDVRKLIERVQSAVLNKFGAEIQPEIRYIPAEK